MDDSVKSNVIVSSSASASDSDSDYICSTPTTYGLQIWKVDRRTEIKSRRFNPYRQRESKRIKEHQRASKS